MPTELPEPVAAEAHASWPHRLRGVLADLAVLLGYLGLAAAWSWPLLTSGPGPHDASPDVLLSTWLFAVSTRSLRALHSPFFTRLAGLPAGVDLAANTSTPLLWIAAFPALLGGVPPLEVVNVALALAPAADAAVAYLVLRRWAPWRPARALGGLLFGFSPYVLHEASGHLHLAWVVFLPVLALLADKLLVRRGAPGTTGLLLGLSLAGQYLISAEVVATAALFLAVGGALTLAVAPSASRARARDLVVAGGAMATSFTLVAGYPIWVEFFGRAAPVGSAHPVHALQGLAGDGAGLIVPSRLLALGTLLPGGVEHLTNRFGQGDTASVGLPLLALVVAVTLTSRDKVVRVAAALAPEVPSALADAFDATYVGAVVRATPSLARRIRGDLARWRVGLVLVSRLTPHWERAAALVAAALGTRPVCARQVCRFVVRRPGGGSRRAAGS